MWAEGAKELSVTASWAIMYRWSLWVAAPSELRAFSRSCNTATVELSALWCVLVKQNENWNVFHWEVFILQTKTKWLSWRLDLRLKILRCLTHLLSVFRQPQWTLLNLSSDTNTWWLYCDSRPAAASFPERKASEISIQPQTAALVSNQRAF